MNSGWVAFDAISLTRVADSQVSYLAYDAENRLKSVSGEVNASYAYDGDGRRVKMVVGGVTGLLWLVGDHLGSGTVSMDAATGVKTYERYKPWGDTRGTTTLPTRYQFTGQRRVAMRVGSTLYYLLADHLGSTTVAAASDASCGCRQPPQPQVYGPWGEVRGETGALPNSFQFTGQRRASLDGL